MTQMVNLLCKRKKQQHFECEYVVCVNCRSRAYQIRRPTTQRNSNQFSSSKISSVFIFASKNPTFKNRKQICVWNLYRSKICCEYISVLYVHIKWKEIFFLIWIMGLKNQCIETTTSVWQHTDFLFIIGLVLYIVLFSCFNGSAMAKKRMDTIRTTKKNLWFRKKKRNVSHIASENFSCMICI